MIVHKQFLFSPTLCAQKDVIIDKFNELLHQLGSEVILKTGKFDRHSFVRSSD